VNNNYYRNGNHIYLGPCLALRIILFAMKLLDRVLALFEDSFLIRHL